MHIELETLPNCVTNLRVELPPDRVTLERQSIVKDFQGQARLPGYRVGKAPKGLVETRFKKESSRNSSASSSPPPPARPSPKRSCASSPSATPTRVELGQDDTLRFTARIITAPEFELPNYQGLTVKVPPTEIADADVDAALDNLRQRLADFNDIEGRGLQMDDFSVIDFAARLDGQPVNEAIPDAAPGTLRQGELLDQARAADPGCPASATPSWARSPTRPATSA